MSSRVETHGLELDAEEPRARQHLVAYRVRVDHREPALAARQRGGEVGHHPLDHGAREGVVQVDMSEAVEVHEPGCVGVHEADRRTPARRMLASAIRISSGESSTPTISSKPQRARVRRAPPFPLPRSTSRLPARHRQAAHQPGEARPAGVAVGVRAVGRQAEGRERNRTNVDPAQTQGQVVEEAGEAFGFREAVGPGAEHAGGISRVSPAAVQSCGGGGSGTSGRVLARFSVDERWLLR